MAANPNVMVGEKKRLSVVLMCHHVTEMAKLWKNVQGSEFNVRGM